MTLSRLLTQATVGSAADVEDGWFRRLYPFAVVQPAGRNPELFAPSVPWSRGRGQRNRRGVVKSALDGQADDRRRARQLRWLGGRSRAANSGCARVAELPSPTSLEQRQPLRGCQAR